MAQKKREGVGPILDINTKRPKGIAICSIGVGSSPDESHLIDMADCTDGKEYANIDVNDLTQVFQDIYQDIEESTIPYNINIKLDPSPGIDNFAISSDLVNIDGGAGLPAGDSFTFNIQGDVAEGATPTSIVTSSSPLSKARIMMVRTSK